MVDHGELGVVLQAFTSLAVKRRRRALTVSELIDHQKFRAQLCAMTGQPDPDRACAHARDVLGLPEPVADEPDVTQPKKKKRKKRAGRRSAARHEDLSGIVPVRAVPARPTAVRVVSVVSTAIESNRRTH